MSQYPILYFVNFRGQWRAFLKASGLIRLIISLMTAWNRVQPQPARHNRSFWDVVFDIVNVVC